EAQDRFLHDSDNTWSFIGEERGGEARRACERALASFAVFDKEAWWTGPLVADLTLKQKKELHRQTYRLLLIPSALHVFQGLETFQKASKVTPEQASASALAMLAKARSMETAGLASSATTRVYLEKWARKLAVFTWWDL